MPTHPRPCRFSLGGEHWPRWEMSSAPEKYRKIFAPALGRCSVLHKAHSIHSENQRPPCPFRPGQRMPGTLATSSQNVLRAGFLALETGVFHLVTICDEKRQILKSEVTDPSPLLRKRKILCEYQCQPASLQAGKPSFCHAFNMTCNHASRTD